MSSPVKGHRERASRSPALRGHLLGRLETGGVFLLKKRVDGVIMVMELSGSMGVC